MNIMKIHKKDWIFKNFIPNNIIINVDNVEKEVIEEYILGKTKNVILIGNLTNLFLIDNDLKNNKIEFKYVFTHEKKQEGILMYVPKSFLVFKEKTDYSNYKLKDEYFKERGYYQINNFSTLYYNENRDYEIHYKGKVYKPGPLKDVSGNKYAWKYSKEKFEFALKHGFVYLDEKSGIFKNKLYQKVKITSTKPYKIVKIGKKYDNITSIYNKNSIDFVFEHIKQDDITMYIEDDYIYVIKGNNVNHELLTNIEVIKGDYKYIFVGLYFGSEIIEKTDAYTIYSNNVVFITEKENPLVFLNVIEKANIVVYNYGIQQIFTAYKALIDRFVSHEIKQYDVWFLS